MDAGPYLVGAEKSLADATVFPTAVFMDHILPNHYGWDTAFGTSHGAPAYKLQPRVEGCRLNEDCSCAQGPR